MLVYVRTSIIYNKSLRWFTGYNLHAGLGPAHGSEGGYICLVTIFPPHFPGLGDRKNKHRWGFREGKDSCQVSEWLPEAQAPVSGWPSLSWAMDDLCHFLE